MNLYFVAAGVLTIVIGLVHSVLGERLIFRRMRGQGLIPTQGGTALREPHVRILWATWHAVTLLAWCVAALLVWLAQPAMQALGLPVVGPVLAVGLVGGALLVLVATKGRHMGWLGLLAAGGLVVVGLNA
jgi:hypothetical protein